MFRWTLFVFICFTGLASAADPGLRIRLKDGSFATGHITGVEQADALGWRCDPFERPFHFDVRAVRSVTSLGTETEVAHNRAAQPTAEPRQMIDLFNGSLLVGRIVNMDDSWITLQTELLGQVQIARQEAAAIIDAQYAGQLVYSGPIDDERWQRLSDDQDWEFEAGALVANKQGASIVGHVQLPAKSQIDLSMSWRGAPDFVLSLGTSANNQVSRVEEVPSAARLEVWANQLALVREVDGGADIAMLSDLSGVNPRIDLTIYLDQVAGTIIVCDMHGRPLETLKVPSPKAITRTSVHLANSGPSLTLEHFEVREWDGITSTVASGDKSVLDTQGENRAGAITGFDPEQRAVRITLANGEELLLPLAQLRRGDLASATQSSVPTNNAEEDGSLPPAVVQPPQLSPATGSADRVSANLSEGDVEHPHPADTISDELTVEIILKDRTRARGRLLATENPQVLGLTAAGLKEKVQFPANTIRGVIGNSQRYLSDELEKPIGTLKTDGNQLAGFLTDAPQGLTGSKLIWRPSTSFNASSISQAASGAIIYRKPLPVQSANSQLPGQPAVNRTRVLAPAVGMFLGNNAAAQETANAQANADDPAVAPAAREIMFRTGDAVDGIVHRIDEQGMTFSSSQSTTTHAPHELIQHVWLNRPQNSRETSSEKLKRLMTVPRSMKADPPTHLFVAVTGDYLRGRLVRLEGDRLTIEVRLDQVELSTSQIAQIIWLHDRVWDDKTSVSSGQKQSADTSTIADAPQAEAIGENDDLNPFLVHGIGRSDRGITFKPQKLVDGILSGHSDLLGECSIAVADLNQLLFGRNITAQIRSFRADPWTLALAQYPRVYLDDGSGEAAPVGMNSEMIGKPAIDFLLRTLDGEAFRLSKNHDRVVVLDFWASWCGPCIQTMPLVEQIVQDMGENQVQLVAVNIQETEARARAAVERLEMNATVLLDIDGQAAAAYQANAIPQTVIIDRAGNVTHVFVGGGPQFVDSFQQALKTVVEGSTIE